MIPYHFDVDGNVVNDTVLPLPGASYPVNTTSTSSSSSSSMTNLTMPRPIPVQIECSLTRELEKTASGTGLAFIAFTEAISQFGVTAPFFAVLFFLMLLTLGLGSMIGTLEGLLLLLTCCY